MRSRSLSIAAAISACLFLFIAGVWIHDRETIFMGPRTAMGMMVVRIGSGIFAEQNKPTAYYDVMLQWHHGCAGFHVGGFHRNHNFLVIPYWLFLVVTAVLPLMWVNRRLQRVSRLARGQCVPCGYDLRQNASGVCPECGTQFF